LGKIVLIPIALVLLTTSAITALMMVRYSTALFTQLQSEYPALWKSLAQPSLSILNPAASLRANEIMFSGNSELDSHPNLSRLYHKSRRLWYFHFVSGSSAVVLFFVQGVINAQ
jgi:hypothetical protein